MNQSYTIDLKPLRDNGWEWFFFTRQAGLWVDPDSGETFTTETALLIQEERSKSNWLKEK